MESLPVALSAALDSPRFRWYNYAIKKPVEPAESVLSMEIQVRAYTQADLPALIRIWNEVVEDGVAFPQEELLDASSGAAFFAEQTCTAVAEDRQTGHIYGLYILHPNNVGRCGHICNASYAVEREARGLHIGEKLVSDCLRQRAGRTLPHPAVQRRRRQQHTREAPVRAPRLPASRRHPRRLPHEGRPL